MITPTLKRGTALVITGPQGCGKSTLARELAQAQGAYAELDMSLVGKRFDVASVLRERPATIVFDGHPVTDLQVNTLKLMLSAEKLTVQGKKGSGSFEIPPPHIVITTTDETAAHRLFDGARHFELFTLPAVV